jgi:hypothetical protein
VQVEAEAVLIVVVILQAEQVLEVVLTVLAMVLQMLLTQLQTQAVEVEVLAVELV